MEAPEVSAGGVEVSTNGKRNLICRTLTGVTRQVGPRFENVVPAYHFCLQLAYKILPTSAQYFGVPCTLMKYDLHKNHIFGSEDITLCGRPAQQPVFL